MRIDGNELEEVDKILFNGPQYDLNWYRRILIFFRIKNKEQYKIYRGVYTVTTGKSDEKENQQA